LVINYQIQSTHFKFFISKFISYSVKLWLSINKFKILILNSLFPNSLSILRNFSESEQSEQSEQSEDTNFIRYFLDY